jgi:ATP-dependent Clp protease ATP-binding subunit ClpC
VVVETEGEGDEAKFVFRGESKSALPDLPPVEAAGSTE